MNSIIRPAGATTEGRKQLQGWQGWCAEKGQMGRQAGCGLEGLSSSLASGYGKLE